MRHLHAATDPAPRLDVPRTGTLVQSYRQLADVFHEILSEQSLDNLLERIAETLADLPGGRGADGPRAGVRA
jgi:hypothetical protein